MIFSTLFKITLIFFDFVFIFGFITNLIDLSADCVIYFSLFLIMQFIDKFFISFLIFSKRLIFFSRMKLKKINYNDIKRIQFYSGNRSLIIFGCSLSVKIFLIDGTVLKGEIGQMFNEKHIKNKIFKICKKKNINATFE